MKALLFLLSVLMAFIAACSDPFESKDDCPCDVKLRELQEDGTYKRSTYRLQTLENPRAVSGSKIQVTFNPRFYSDGTTDDITPEAQYFVNKDGVIIPTTTLSEELFSIYKIMEDFYFFDIKIGLDKTLKYPRKVSIHNKSKAKGQRENAMYAPLFDRIIVLSYDGKIAPLGLNKGIMAHEHFHAIFTHIVSPIQNTVNDIRFFANHSLHQDGSNLLVENSVIASEPIPQADIGYNFLILDALNEGLADFWANLHTNLANSYTASYSPDEKGVEGREVFPRIYPTPKQETLEEALDLNKYKLELTEKSSNKPIHGNVYSQGVRYSNIIKSISLKIVDDPNLSSEEKKILIGQWIVESLKKLSQVVSLKGKVAILSQAEILENFIPEGRQDILGAVCSDLNAFLAHHPKVASCSGR